MPLGGLGLTRRCSGLASLAAELHFVRPRSIIENRLGDHTALRSQSPVDSSTQAEPPRAGYSARPDSRRFCSFERLGRLAGSSAAPRYVPESVLPLVSARFPLSPPAPPLMSKRYPESRNAHSSQGRGLGSPSQQRVVLVPPPPERPRLFLRPDSRPSASPHQRPAQAGSLLVLPTKSVPVGLALTRRCSGFATPGTGSTRSAVRCTNQERSHWARPNPSLQRTRYARR